MTRRRSLLAALLFFLGLVLTACGTAGMPIPPGTAKPEQPKAIDRDNPPPPVKSPPGIPPPSSP